MGYMKCGAAPTPAELLLFVVLILRGRQIQCVTGRWHARYSRQVYPALQRAGAWFILDRAQCALPPAACLLVQNRDGGAPLRLLLQAKPPHRCVTVWACVQLHDAAVEGARPCQHRLQAQAHRGQAMGRQTAAMEVARAACLQCQAVVHNQCNVAPECCGMYKQQDIGRNACCQAHGLHSGHTPRCPAP